jgi:hypothetical protein
MNLPKAVFDRLVETLGPRLVEGKYARLVADKYDTKEENRLYSLLLFRSLLTDGFESYSRFVRVNESQKDLIEQHNQILREDILKQAAEPQNAVFSLRFC